MKKNIKVIILFSILFLSIGFAAVNTVLNITGNLKLAENIEDFNVYFYSVKKEDEKVNEVINESKNKITIDTSSFTSIGEKQTYTYRIANSSRNYDANVSVNCTPTSTESFSLTNVLVEDSIEASKTIDGTITLEYLSETTGIEEFTCLIEVEAIERTELADEFGKCEFEDGTVWEFNYKKQVQEFAAPCNGMYKIELWGASSGTSSNSALGGYTAGELFLERESELYIYTGESSNNISATFNGGGACNQDCTAGGGATDVRLINGSWDDENGLKSRIMVAGGGGGANLYANSPSKGGAAGGLEGYYGITSRNNLSGSTGGGQASGGIAIQGGSTGYDGSFGKGGTAGGFGGGGGGGYYGGGGGSNTPINGGGESAGGGGSSFISGHAGCIAVTESLENAGCLSMTTSSNCSKHYSGYVFSNTKMIDGAGYNWKNVKGESIGMPNHAGTGTITGNSGNGYAKITYLGFDDNSNNDFSVRVGDSWNTAAYKREEVFIAPITGTYKIELWGASGGTSSLSGLGGYTSGKIHLEENINLFIHVGKSYNGTTATYNGGGSCNNACYAGGGATDVRLLSGTWNDFDSLKSRIMIAAGGGGPNLYSTGSSGGYGGGLNGRNGYGRGVNNGSGGGTQTSGGIAAAGGSAGYNGSFGIGGNAGSYGGGAGGGYYGGGGGSNSPNIGGGESAGGGGSSFISGHNGCNAIDISSTKSSIVHTGSSIHYSNYSFSDTLVVDGEGYSWNTGRTSYTGMPNYTSTATKTGNSGDGYAKITLISID